MRLIRTIKVNILLSIALLLAFQLASAQFSGFEILSRNGKTTFGFEKVNNQIIIPVLLNDSLPLKFILDTGVKNTILIDKAISDIVNITYDRSVSISVAGHVRELNAYLANNVSLSMPGISGRGQSLIVLEEDYLELREHLGMDVHGIIGYEFFSHFVVMINYGRKLITVYDPEVFRPRRRHTAIPFTIEQSRPYITNTSITQHDGTVINPKLLLDSGASHGLMLETDTDEDISMPGKTLETIIGWGLGGELSGYLGRIKSLSIDKFKLKDVLVSYVYDFSHQEVIRIIGRNGSIGGDVLSRFTVTFDYPGNMLYLRKNKTFRQAFEFNLSGINLIAIGLGLNSFMIINVIENSPASQAGVRVGDVILAVNRRFSFDLTIAEINNKLHSGAGRKMNLTLARNSEIVRVSFRLKRLI